MTPSDINARHYGTPARRTRAIFALTLITITALTIGVGIVTLRWSALTSRNLYMLGLGFVMLLANWISIHRKYARLQALEDSRRVEAELLATLAAWVWQFSFIIALLVIFLLVMIGDRAFGH